MANVTKFAEYAVAALSCKVRSTQGTEGSHSAKHPRSIPGPPIAVMDPMKLPNTVKARPYPSVFFPSPRMQPNIESLAANSTSRSTWRPRNLPSKNMYAAGERDEAWKAVYYSPLVAKPGQKWLPDREDSGKNVRNSSGNC